MAPKGRKARESGAAEKTKEAEPVSWPKLQPLRDPLDLQLEWILEGQVAVIETFWTQNLCKKYVSFLSGLPLLTTPGKPKKGEALRVNDRFQIDDERFAKTLWEETCLKQLVTGDGDGDGSNKELWGGDVTGLNANIRIYRYGKGQFFGAHYDESNRVETAGIASKTTWTLLMYLSECTGGETVFYNDDGRELAAVKPQMGLALLHRHGDECLLHEGREVVEGEKWIVRSDVCVRR